MLELKLMVKSDIAYYEDQEHPEVIFIDTCVTFASDDSVDFYVSNVGSSNNCHNEKL